MSNIPRLIEVTFPFKQAYIDLNYVCKRFDKTYDVCYKINTSPLLLREQGARRPIAASAFLHKLHRLILQVGL